MAWWGWRAAWGFVAGWSLTSCLAAESVDFNRDVRPILASKCFACHGPDEAGREADLRLDLPDAVDGPFHRPDGAVLVPEDPNESSLWQRITSSDGDTRMPPPDADVRELTPSEQDVLKRWIEQGAKYAAFWAFEPPQRRRPPPVDTFVSAEQAIDRFVLARLEQSPHTMTPRADRRTLLRRVTFDLTGLPPKPAELSAFLADSRPDAFQRVVDRLLSSPRYGEHMAKYWLDVVRFADTNGIHHDHYREMTPYRDWVIRAFNKNLPFDKFVIDQLAGDLHAKPTQDELIASGFQRLHLVIDRGTAIPEESFVRNVIDRVTAVGTAFMGLTVGCAVCHDHKYDPLTQRDFYQLFAFFNNIDAGPETPGRGLHAPFIRLPTTEQRLQRKVVQAEIDQLNGKLEILEEVARKPLQEKLSGLKKSLEQLEISMPVSLVMRERKDIRPAHILIRGAYDQPGEQVERNTPSFLPPLQASGDVKTRMDLARWLVDPAHPLTARVTVNRLWQQFFGVGLVKTSEDFGTQGEMPSHPQLLDYLATEFVDHGWDVKSLVRQLVSSRVYQLSSVASARAYQADADNRWLARGSRFRLDAEMIRDQILYTSGLLHPQMYGRSVKPPQPPNLWKSVSMRSSSTYAFSADTGDKIFRRSVYSFWKRALPPPQMTIFDAPTREQCTARRERTNTPLQALVLMNEDQYFRAARRLAREVVQKEQGDELRLAELYESVTCYEPDRGERAMLVSGLNSLRAHYRQHLPLARKLTSEWPALSDAESVDLAAHAMLVNTLFNLDVTKTRE